MPCQFSLSLVLKPPPPSTPAVVAWPTRKFGKFHEGDSYIILNTFKPDPESEKLAFDLHFWIGDYSTQDEYGTAAYKTVECDAFLNDAAVQHREIQGHESELFLSYFKRLIILEGGVDTGFNHVEPSVRTPHLYQVKGTKGSIALKQLATKRSSLNEGDSFVLDVEEAVYVWHGKEANKDEKQKALQFAQSMAQDRGSVKV